jgi:hypothetical protein
MTDTPQRRSRVPFPKIEVHATADLLDRAMRKDSLNCFVAEAIKAAAPQFTKITVDLQFIRLTDPTKRLRYLYATPRSAQMAIIAFDQGIAPEPFSFTLNRVTQVIRGRGPSQERTDEERKEQVLQRRRERATQRREIDAEYRGPDEPFQAPVEYTNGVRKALDDPYALLGTGVAMDRMGTGGANLNGNLEVVVGGHAPRYLRKKDHNMGITRKFGLRELRGA